MIQFRAHFDGRNLCPDQPVELPLGVTLQVTVAEVPSNESPDSHRERRKALTPAEMFAQIESKIGLHEHPTDWSAEHDHYLSGAPKRNGTTPE